MPMLRPTRFPTYRPTPEPRLRPTPNPTPRPTPSPTPRPTPSPTPRPTLIRRVIPDVNTATIPDTMLAQAITDAFDATVPDSFLDRFPDQVFQQIMQDSPSAFVPGFVTLGSQNKDLADYDINAKVPIMDFEVVGEGDSLEVDGYFTTRRPLVTIPDGTVVRVYAQDGLHATSTVDVASGYFRIAITGIPPGSIPILFTFSSPSYDGITNELLNRKLLTNSPRRGNFASPCFAYVKNPNKCAPALTFTLAWDGPTSNVDIHVFEPSGTEVYYDNHIGTYGSLDVNNRDGYGPENYFCPNTTPRQIFRAKVYAFSVGRDATVVWTLHARTYGRLLWTKSGAFTRSNEYSGSFDVMVGKAGRVSCDNTCPPTYDSSWWWTVWNFYGDDEYNNQGQIDLYNAISSIQNPDKQDLKLFVHLLFLPAVAKTSDRNYRSAYVTRYERSINAITTSCDIPCTTGFILEAVCDFANRESSSRALEFLLEAVKTLETVAPFFAGSGLIDWERGYLQYLESLWKFKRDKFEILEEVNGAATLRAIDDLGSRLQTCTNCNRGLGLGGQD